MHHAIKTYWDSESIVPCILNLDTRWEKWSASHLSHFTPGERTSGTQWKGGWSGPLKKSGHRYG